MNPLHRLLCRMTGRGCSPDRPSSKDLKLEMQAMGRKAEAQTAVLRRQRLDTASLLDEMIGDVTGHWKREEGHRG